MDIIAYKRRQNPIRKQISLKDETQKTIKALMITLGVIIVSLAVIFMLINTKTNERGYTLEQEKLRNGNLKSLNEDLAAKITKSTTSSGINSSDKIKDMTETQNKTYVTREDNSIK